MVLYHLESIKLFGEIEMGGENRDKRFCIRLNEEEHERLTKLSKRHNISALFRNYLKALEELEDRQRE